MAAGPRPDRPKWQPGRARPVPRRRAANLARRVPRVRGLRRRDHRPGALGHTRNARGSYPRCPSRAACSRAADPEELAGRVRVRLVGDLPQPSATTSPAAGEPAIVNHPTFLAVDGWTETVTDQECAFLLCVTVTATAQLTWNPGEPGAPTVTCDAGGTTYDPTGPPAAEQAAAPGACTHAYTQRTGAAGRPAAWPGAATVTWNLTWTSTVGPGGTLTPVTRTIDLPRAVDEVQAVVVR